LLTLDFISSSDCLCGHMHDFSESGALSPYDLLWPAKQTGQKEQAGKVVETTYDAKGKAGRPRSGSVVLSEGVWGFSSFEGCQREGNSNVAA
jgi:hypothetical protein